MYRRIPLSEKARPIHLELVTEPFFCEGESLNVFIPVYLRMVIQKVKQLEMRKLTATLSGYIEMTLNLKDVPKAIVDFVRQNVQL